ncbi:dTDP-4-amino-4,6-dideoxygalactose transaminase [bacterium]|nr:dTDP-4-amino-4,6-dideoxygalactose transaminase [bacterium]MDB4607449.1 dTDP-4-amino-4,6-dideoxygalactose transaminase [bacterium]MDC0304523.1 dTDP-4-amino-4,6-dideoxygalactose transaminase [Akkermansiaceae bacterium]
MKIPFVKAPLTGHEVDVVTEAIRSGHHGGDGPFTKKVHTLIEGEFGVGKCLLTTSCTDALEMCALLLDANPGDEIIIPSYTFSSTALAFAMHGFKPVFVDVNLENKNITLENIKPAVTPKTRAIVVVHYAGIVCDMDPIMDFACEQGLIVVEDAAQAVNSKYKGRYAGSIGHLATYSFHATKSYSCGEGGALLLNDKKYFERANFLWEKGTDRSLVLAGVKNKYSWVDWGSSFLLSDLLASLLYDQLQNKDVLQAKRRSLHEKYTNIFEELRLEGISYLKVPANVETNFHAFWIEFEDGEKRERVIRALAAESVSAYIGYVPLHSSPKGKEVGKIVGKMKNTDKAGSGLMRLPFYLMDEPEIEYVEKNLKNIFIQ